MMMKFRSLIYLPGALAFFSACHINHGSDSLPAPVVPVPADEAGAYDHSHAELTRVLQQHVKGNRFDYAGLQRDSSGLESYLARSAMVSHETFDGWSDDEQLAYLINLYNAATLKLVIDHYPINSIKDIGGLLGNPWKMPVVQLFGERVTLNHIEHDWLRAKYQEPRIHFAVNCASLGCPALRNEAFRGTVLDRQLTEQGQAFLRDVSKNRVDVANRTLHLSPIFHWFKGDFTAQAGSPEAFIAPYFEPDLRRQIERETFRIARTDYDWDLNDVAQ